MTALPANEKREASSVTRPDAQEAPPWFSRALQVSPRQSFIEVESCPIRVLQWGPPDRPPLVFVHGNAAHAEWWSFIAPFFAATRSVAAFDLSGMGESSERRDYAPSHFGAEIVAVIEKLVGEGAPGPADVVAHSFGGLGAIFGTHARPDLVRRLTIIDTPFLEDSEGPPRWRSRSGRKRIFASREEALSNFRLLPPQKCENAYLFDFVASRSIKRVAGGWTWRFSANPWNFAAFQDGFWAQTNGKLRELEPPVAFVRGEWSTLCDEKMMQRWRDCRGRDDIVVTIPAAHHHIMLDQPFALVSVLRTLLAV